MSAMRRPEWHWSVLVLMFAAFAIWAGLWLSPVGEILENSVPHRAEFLARAQFKREPPLDPRIKIFSYGDLAFETFGAPELLAPKDWAMVLGSIAAQKPRAILVDRMFNIQGLTPEDREVFRGLKAMGVPIYVAASVHDTPLKRRELIPNSLFMRYRGSIPFEIRAGQNKNAYGPSRELLDIFSGVGHIVLVEDGYMEPLFAWDDGYYLPTLGLRAAARLDLEREGVLVDGRAVPVDGKGRIPVNFSSRNTYATNLLSMVSVVDAARKGKAAPGVSAGDIVVVLPQMFTGSVDFKRTPVGKMEGGLLHVAVVNSIVSGRWIVTLGDSRWLGLGVLLLMSAIGAVGAHFLTPRRGFIFLGAGAFLSAACGLGLFSFYEIRLFWFHPLLAFSTAGAFVLMNKAISMELHSRRVNHALEGLVSPGLLKTLMRDPGALQLDPKEIHATVMFVDVEGFSLRAEIRRPAQVFFELKEQLSRVVAIVHKHGGIIDKTLGDGLLAFFGHSYDERHAGGTKNHAYAALACAVEIQRECAKAAVLAQDKIAAPGENAGKPESVLPLRIGLNSGPVYLGNLGTGLRIDFTIVGDTVNFAKRLEDASETFRVMIGSHTRELLRVAPPVSGGVAAPDFQIPPGSALRKRLLSIKHHHELIEGWECDPFAFEPEVFRAALTSARERISRNAQRWRVPDEVPCVVIINRGAEGRLLNFSLSGLGFDGVDYLARRVQVTIELDSPDGSLRRRLQEAGLLPLVCVVRWGSVQEGVVKHGVQLMNFEATQREQLVKILLDDIARRYEAQSH